MTPMETRHLSRTRKTNHPRSSHGPHRSKKPKGPKPIKFMKPLEKKLMDYGDKVVAYFDPTVQYLLMLQPGKTFDCKFGHFLHSNFVGKEYGSKVGLLYGTRSYRTPKAITSTRSSLTATSTPAR